MSRFKNKDAYSHSSGGWRLRSRPQHSQVLVGASPWNANGSSSVHTLMVQGSGEKQALSAVSCWKDTNCVIGPTLMTFSNPNLLPKAPGLNGFTWVWGGTGASSLSTLGWLSYRAGHLPLFIASSTTRLAAVYFPTLLISRTFSNFRDLGPLSCIAIPTCSGSFSSDWVCIAFCVEP